MIRTAAPLRIGVALLAAGILLLAAVCVLIPGGGGTEPARVELDQRLIEGTERLLVSITAELTRVGAVGDLARLETGRWSGESGKLTQEIRKRFAEADAIERRLLDDLQRVNGNIDALKVQVTGAMKDNDLVKLKEGVAGMVSSLAGRIAAYREEYNREIGARESAARRRGIVARVLAALALVCLVVGLTVSGRSALRAKETIDADIVSLQRTLGRWLSGGFDPWSARSPAMAGTLEGPLEVLRSHVAAGVEKEREAKGYLEALEILDAGIEDGLAGSPCPVPDDHPAASAIRRAWGRLRHAGERGKEEADDRERVAARLREEIAWLQRQAEDVGSRLRAQGFDAPGVPGSQEWWDGVRAALATLAAGRDRALEEGLEAGRSIASAAGLLDRLAESIREVGEGISETVESQQHQITALGAPAEGLDRLGARVAQLLDEVQTSRKGLDELIRHASVQAHRSLGIADRAAEVQGLIEQVAEVAKKTNLLALNAAIEAAGAGEYGKGFAVVAKEIRNLAIRSAQTAETLGATIADMRKQSTMSVLTAEEEGKMARKAADAFERYVPALTRLQSGLEDFKRLMDESRGVFRDGMRSGGALGERMSGAVTMTSDLADRFREIAGGGRG